MPREGHKNDPIRFGVFEADLAGRTLRKAGVRVRLQEKPFRVLAMLLDRPGEVVTREELKQELWPNEEYGEFDLGLNTAVKKVRAALGDSGDSPKWIETAPKVGYKFLGPVESAASTVALPAGPAARPGPAFSLWGAVAAGVVAALLAAWGFGSLRGPSDGAETAVYRFTVQPPEGGVIRSFELSPDGRRLAFVVQQGEEVRLWLRSFNEEVAHPIEGAANLDRLGTPFWSPDSRHIAFFAENMLKRVGINGEPPIVLADAPRGRSGSWNRDGLIIFTPDSNAGLYAVSDAGGTPERITREAFGSQRSPFFLPDGRQFLFYDRTEQPARIRLGRLGDPETVALSEHATHSVYVPSSTGSLGYLLGVRDGALVAQRFNAEAAEYDGDAFPAAVPRVGHDENMSRGLFSVSATGTLAYLPKGPTYSRQLLEVDRGGEAVRRFEIFGKPWDVRLAPDRTRVLVGTFDLANGGGLEMLDLRGGSSLKVRQHGPGRHSWSPDGQSLAFGGRQGVFRINDDGSAQVDLDIDRTGLVDDWSPDGHWLIIRSRNEEGDFDLFTAELSSGRTQPLSAAEFDERMGRFSPSGRHVAYSSDETGEHQIYVIRFPDGDGKRRISIDGGVVPVWGPDGKELFYRSSENMLMVAAFGDEGNRLTSERPVPVFPLETDPQGLRDDLDRYPNFSFAAYDALGGDRFLITRSEYSNEPQPIHVVVNWRSELERIDAQRLEE